MDGTRFSWKFSGQLYMVFLPVSPASLIESCSFWYGLKDPFPVRKLGTDSVVLDRKGTWRFPHAVNGNSGTNGSMCLSVLAEI